MSGQVRGEDRPREACSWTPGSGLETPAYRPCVPLLVAMAVGIVLDSRWAWGYAAWLGVACAAGAGWWLAWRRGLARVGSAWLMVAVAATAAAWSDVQRRCYDADEVGRDLDEVARPMTCDALVVRGPRIVTAPPPQPLAGIPRGDTTRLVVLIERVRAGDSWRRASGRAAVSVEGHLLGVEAGDRVRLHGAAWRTGAPLNPGQANYAEFGRAERTLARIAVPTPESVATLKRGSMWNPRRWSDVARRSGQRWLARHVPAEQADLAAAVLLGARESLDEERSDAFFRSGLAHLLAVSGLNVAIFAYGFWFVARLGWIPRRPAIVIVAGLALAYAALTDAEPPVLRAALLVATSALGRWSGRRTAGENTLASAACVVLMWDPASLFHAGAQLSFLAVAVLDRLPSGGVDPAERDPWLRLVRSVTPWPVRWLQRGVELVGESLLAGTLVWLVTCPLVIFRFHLISPIALLLNPLVMGPMTVAMYAGGGALLLSTLWPWGADCLGWLCGACLGAIETIIAAALRLPGNHAWLPSPSVTWVLFFYGVAAVGVMHPRWMPSLGRCFAGVALWLSWGAVAIVPEAELRRGLGLASPAEVRVTFVAVGHGTAALIELPDGETVLYDAGRLGNPNLAARSVAGTLWHRRRTHLDALVISHADTDHYNGVPELLRRFSVGAVYVSPAMFDERSAALDQLRTAIERSGAPLRSTWAGQRWEGKSGARIEVWRPSRGDVAGADNSRSIVLAVEFAGRRLLLPGDLESPGLDEMLNGPPRPCDVVMAPHHGSRQSQPRGFAAWTSPRYVVISGARRRDDDEVRRAYAEVGCQVLHTWIDGAVEVRWDQERLSVRAWRRDPF